MRRTSLISAVAAAALSVLSVVVPADAAGARADLRSDAAASLDRTLAVRPLRLGCEVRAADAAVVVHCRWSRIDAAAAGVRLWRSDPTADGRQVIFRSEDTSITSYTDTDVRRNHRYTYVVQLVDPAGRVLAQSRPVTVFVPPPDDPDVETLRLACALGREAVGCEWSRPTTPTAEVVELWRSVDGGARELVGRFRAQGETTYRDPVPDGASRIAYAVLAKDAAGRLVGRSRAELVRIPDAQLVDVVSREGVAP